MRAVVIFRTGRLSLAVVIGLFVSFILGGACAYLGAGWLASELKPSARAPEPLPKKTKISGLGRLQPRGGVIAVYGPPGDRIDELKVKQGDPVKADAVLAVLESRKDRELECTLAELQLKEAQTQSAAIQVAGEKKMAAIDAEVKQLKDARELDLRAQDTKIGVQAAQAKSAENQWDRVKGLKSGVSAQELERSELLVRQAEGELAAARTIRKKTEISYDNSEKVALAKKAAAQAELDEALKRLPIDTAKQNLKIAQRRRDATEIKAPVAGTILKINSREGDATGLGPILQMADTQTMVAVVEVYEADVADLDTWLKTSPVSATITSRAIPGATLKGELKPQQITRLIQQNQVFSMNPREAVDRRVIEVRVDIDPASTELASRYIGLQVEVDLEPRP